MTVKLLLMQIGAEDDPERYTLSALRSVAQPNQVWLCAMELHAKVICPSLHSQARAVQLSKKASFRQDLSRLNLPYRLATRPELDALKAAGQLSIQAPSAMLMKISDGVILLNARGHRLVRKTIVRQCTAWTKGTARTTAAAPVPPPQPLPMTGRGKRKARDYEPVAPVRVNDESQNITIQPYRGAAGSIEVATDSSEDSNDVQTEEDEEDPDLSAAEILTSEEWYQLWRTSHEEQLREQAEQAEAERVAREAREARETAKRRKLEEEAEKARAEAEAGPIRNPDRPDLPPFAVSTRSAFSKYKTRGRKSAEPVSYTYTYQFPVIQDNVIVARHSSKPNTLLQSYPPARYC